MNESEKPVGDWLMKAAEAEAARVHSFRQLVQELESHGAPRELVRRARLALQDEVRLARVLASLVEQWLGELPPVQMRAISVRELLALALDNAERGCARETFSALIALVQAGRAQDQRIARAMRRKAHDQLRHAQLSWDLHDWFLGHLSFKDSARVERVLARSLPDLPVLHDPSALPEASRIVLGLPDALEVRDLAARMTQSLQQARHVA